MERNKGQVLTDQQCKQIAKRLFKAIDQDERKTLNKEQAVEFVAFLKDHLFHASYKESRDKPKIEALFDSLDAQKFELKLPNDSDPEHPFITEEKRVTFKPLFDAVYGEARSDGCIWIPFEETSPKPKMSYAEASEMAASRENLRA